MGDFPLRIIGHGILLSIASSMLMVFANPPFDMWPLAFVGLIPLYFAVRNSSPLQAFGLTWLSVFIGFMTGCIWWVPLLSRFAHLSWIVSLGLTILACGYQAIIYALWALTCSFLNRRLGLSWIISGPLCIVLIESAVPFLFKMYLAILVWRAWPMMQVAEIGGPPAVSALIVLANLVLAEIILARNRRRHLIPAAKAGVAVFILVIAIGWFRAIYVDNIRNDAPKLNIGLLQPNFGIVSAKERALNGAKYVKSLQKATAKLAKQEVDIIVWPESSWPYLFDRKIEKEYPSGHPWELRGDFKGRLFFGTLTHEFGGSSIYNSAVLLSEAGEIKGVYDKHLLVPFGEFIPFKERFPEAARRCRERLPEWPEITRGESQALLVDKDLRIGSLICSEDLEMNFTHSVAMMKPNLLVSIASDAWFGDGAAARQHLAMAAFRAVETRRDFARGTNTGVSAIVDALGRVQLEGPLMDVPINKPLEPILLNGEVALLDVFAFGPYAVRFFPGLCMILLIIFSAIAYWNE